MFVCLTKRFPPKFVHVLVSVDLKKEALFFLTIVCFDFVSERWQSVLFVCFSSDILFKFETVTLFEFLSLKNSYMLVYPPQWGAADAEIKVPSSENTQLKRSPFKAWSRSVYGHTCYAYCQGFLPCLFLPFRSIHLDFSKTSLDFFLCWLWLTPVAV